MSYLELFFIAVGLSMDAFAVSITNGLCCSGISKRQMIAMGLCFGGFQGFMPILGFALGMAFESYITALDHYIALVLLCYIGGSMALGAIRSQEEHSEYQLTVRTLLVQGIATSIDALALGISFAALPDVSITAAALTIAGITCLCSILGACFGKSFGYKLGNRAQIVGGLILIVIGIKIFCEHVFFG